MKTIRKSAACILLAAVLLLSFHTAAIAQEPDSTPDAQRRMKYIDLIAASLSITDRVALCTLSGSISPDYDYKYTITLRSSSDLKNWSTVKSWSKKVSAGSDIVFYDRSYGDGAGQSRLTIGRYYRCDVTINVLGKTGLTLEAVSESSGPVLCGYVDSYSASPYAVLNK